MKLHSITEVNVRHGSVEVIFSVLVNDGSSDLVLSMYPRQVIQLIEILSAAHDQAKTLDVDAANPPSKG